MLENHVTIVTVNYNTPQVTIEMIKSLRKFYPIIPIVIVDGSDIASKKTIMDNMIKDDPHIQIFSVGYNIHHGPGMDYGLGKVTTKYTLIIDPDVIITNGGMIEYLDTLIRVPDISPSSDILYMMPSVPVEDISICERPNNISLQVAIDTKLPTAPDDELAESDEYITNDYLYVGVAQTVTRQGLNCTKSDTSLQYIHPSFMLVNTTKYGYLSDGSPCRKFFKHGSPCINTMLDIHDTGNASKMLLSDPSLSKYYLHDGRGVVNITGYNLRNSPARSRVKPPRLNKSTNYVSSASACYRIPKVSRNKHILSLATPSHKPCNIARVNRHRSATTSNLIQRRNIMAKMKREARRISQKKCSGGNQLDIISMFSQSSTVIPREGLHRLKKKLSERTHVRDVIDKTPELPQNLTMVYLPLLVSSESNPVQFYM